ncbi:hypothetical protein T03_7607 [Trichinella britovi]|uniref:Uncharacterized protein n=1 Tax=Trichinella britovi TaxID=45882 RepID=A0A0V1AHJ3_TRIBR|nr:hypothetical protein T03_11773 [Trichinella britovi]KRY24110.1 hypothetical protein T03_7607 [Trichinella britovi]
MDCRSKVEGVPSPGEGLGVACGNMQIFICPKA